MGKRAEDDDEEGWRAFNMDKRAKGDDDEGYWRWFDRAHSAEPPSQPKYEPEPGPLKAWFDSLSENAQGIIIWVGLGLFFAFFSDCGAAQRIP